MLNVSWSDLNNLLQSPTSKAAMALQSLKKSPEGQRVIDYLLAKSGLLETSHIEGDPCATAFAEGRRSIGLELMKLLHWNAADLLAASRRQSQSSLPDHTEGVSHADPLVF